MAMMSPMMTLDKIGIVGWHRFLISLLLKKLALYENELRTMHLKNSRELLVY